MTLPASPTDLPDLSGLREESLPEPEQVGRAIFKLFETAVSHRLKWPRIQLRVGDATVLIKRAGQQSKHCGQILITDGVKYPFSTWYGRIDETGTLYPSRALIDKPAIYNLLCEFAANPIECATRQGQLFGNCIFCRRRLSDPRSTGHGHGPICARRFGLAWDADRKLGGFHNAESVQ